MIENKIQILRLTRGFPQKYMANKLGIRQETYSRIESGNQKIKSSDPLLTRIAEVLNVPVAELVNDHPILVCTGDILGNGHQLEGKEAEIADLKRQLAQKDAQIEKLLGILHSAGGGVDEFH